MNIGGTLCSLPQKLTSSTLFTSERMSKSQESASKSARYREQDAGWRLDGPSRMQPGSDMLVVREASTKSEKTFMPAREKSESENRKKSENRIRTQITPSLVQSRGMHTRGPCSRVRAIQQCAYHGDSGSNAQGFWGWARALEAMPRAKRRS